MSQIAAELPPDSGLVPGWLERLSAIGWRLLAAIALGLVLLWIAALLGVVTASVLVAAIVAATFAPFVLALRDRGWSRIKAAAAVFLAAAAVILATLIIVGLAFLPYAAAVVDDLKAGLASFNNLLAQYNIPPEVRTLIDHATQGLQAWVSNSASELASDLGTVFTIGLLATFLTFFFLMDGDKAWVWAMASANEWRRGAISTAGHVALQRVGGYLRGTAVLAAVDGLVEGLFLLILGVPHALPLAVIVFFGRFIPYIGGLVTTILLLLATLASQGTTAALILLVLVTILNVIQGKVLAPAIYQKTVHIHPAIVLVALPAGAALAGIIGLFAAIPVVAFALAIVGALISVLGVEPTAESTTKPIVPIWLDRLGQWSWRMLVSIGLLAVVISVAIQIPLVILPLVLGIVLASTLLPLSRRLEQRGWSKGRAALGATVGATLGVIVIVGLTIVSLAGPANELVSTAVAGASSSNDSVGGNAGPLVTLVQTYGAGVLITIAGVLSGVAGLVVVLFLAVLLTFYFLRDGDDFWGAFLARVEPGRRSRIDAAGTRAVNVLGGYMVGTGAISIFGAATQFLIMTLLGIPLALPLAVLAIFGGFIPYIGSLVTTGLAFLVTVATGSPQDIVIMAIFTIVFNIVQGNIVAPIVYSRVVSLHPAVVLVAIPAGNAVAGVVGMFLVVPFLGVVATVWRTVLRVLDTEPVEMLDDAEATDTRNATQQAPQPTIATP
jgi:predicted PurR-regulated permease PerM